ncbi:TPR repeat protein [Lipingzhangella halophila]|uniref:non-specific serine/threonine protein kinase n=1 Tax=Lipingzhangella halophila TaxID=1783352 RepID=A0A7W7RFJ4_9ACTN|nr:serine/threonine-protein kinase [Lipingzhangella halophila]MBB4931067.1 TPR repeat protein [Lipingzhangella halophila]
MAQQVGGFRLIRELGSGGFGAVHLGEDSSGRRAAVKLLHPHLAKDAQVRRYFSQELANARQVQGFCVAEILDADAEAEQPWLATEYVEGPTLGQAVREHGPRTGGDSQRLAVQTITALAAIHAAGVVHRDFKPANILLGPDGPRVIDFGIARALDADTSSATQIGTLGYMAPEQLEGTTLGPAADLFAWGAIIVHAATGAEAFPGPTQAARISRTLTHPPETGDLADPLLSIVLACMDKDPAQRPTARQILDMLLTGRTAPSAPEPPSATPTFEPYADEETRLRRAGEAGDTNAMFNLGRLLRNAGRVVEAERWYRQAAEAGHTNAMNNLGNLLSNVGRIQEAERRYRQAAEAGNPKAMYNLGLLLKGAGRDEEAERWYRQAAEAGHTNAMNNLGVLLRDAGRVVEAERWYRQAAEAGHTNAMNNLGVLLRDAGRVVEAERWYRQAAEAGHTNAMNNLGNLLSNVGRIQEAERWYRQAVEAGRTKP